MIKKADKKEKEMISESRIKQENIGNYRGKKVQTTYVSCTLDAAKLIARKLSKKTEVANQCLSCSEAINI